MVKVAIFSSYGLNYVPDELTVGNLNSIKSRVDLAKKISCLPHVREISKGDLEKAKGNFIRVKFKNRDIVYCLQDNGDISLLEVVDVDISKPWKIVEYDGAESIEYFKGVVVIDKFLNFCSW